MSVFCIGMYDICDHERFQRYPSGVVALLPKYGGKVFASDTKAIAIEGPLRSMNAIIEFPSVDAALGLYHDLEYAPLKRLRHESTKNTTMVLVERFQH